MEILSVLILGLLAAVSSAADCCNCVDPSTHPSATIDTGPVAGTITSLPDSDVVVNKFLGIPFAKPPARFSPPEPAVSWSPRILDASKYKPSCVQNFGNNSEVREWIMGWANTPPPVAGESENCLSINVWAPASESEELKPVLLWMFGGSFQFGTGSWETYDGTSFVANHDVVVVTYNYRTNVFGFPGAPELADEDVNLGFLDSRLALDWVQRNIAAFGGDPDKVTIFGESAGAGIVDTLILAPPDPLPFRAAILQSGQGSLVDTNIGPRGETWRILLEKAGCPEDGGLECVRELPSQTLADLVQSVGAEFKAVPGVETWPADPQYLRRNSTEEKPIIARVPVLIGSNDDEGQVFAYTFSGSTEDFLRDNLHISDQELIDGILEMYPIGSPDIPDERQQIAKISGDISFTCPLYAVAADSTNVTIPTWRYLYNATFPEPQLYEGSGSFHTAELRPLFGTYNHDSATEEHHAISRAMQKAWADFAKDPQQGPGWARHPEVGVFGAGDDGMEALEATELQASDLRCETWLAAFLS